MQQIYLWNREYFCKSQKNQDSFQYRKPSLSWLGPPPTIIISIQIMWPIITQTFKEDNQNSTSPKYLTPAKLIPTTRIT